MVGPCKEGNTGKMSPVSTDETQPLLRSITNEGHQVYTNPPADAQHDTDSLTTIVDFDPAGDPDNPLDWPTPFKWAIVSILALMSFAV